MSERSGGDDAARRAEVLARTARTYEEYRSSGYSERWAGGGPGMVRATAERDAWLVDALRPALGGLVVDLGAGEGTLGVLLDAAGARPARLVGVDILGDRLARARDRVPWGEFVEASADGVPLPGGAAGAVVAMTLLSSLTDPWFRDRVAMEVDRLLAPGGRFVVYDIRYPSPANQAVVPIRTAELRRLFPGWHLTARSLTLLPPLARRSLVGGGWRYGLLHGLPLLRSHLGSVLVKP